MMFGSPLPGVDLYRDHMLLDDPAAECGLRFGGIFLRLLTELWRMQPFAAPADEDIDPSLRAQLGRYRELVGSRPAARRYCKRSCAAGWGCTGWSAWRYSGTCGSRSTTRQRMFELMLGDLAAMLGLRYPLPS